MLKTLKWFILVPVQRDRIVSNSLGYHWQLPKVLKDSLKCLPRFETGKDCTLPQGSQSISLYLLLHYFCGHTTPRWILDSPTMCLYWFLSSAVPNSEPSIPELDLSIASLVVLTVLSHQIFLSNLIDLFSVSLFAAHGHRVKNTWPWHLNLSLFTRAFTSGSSCGVLKSLYILIRHSPSSWIGPKILFDT